MLISRSGIRYEGTLHEVDASSSLVALRDVKSFGQEHCMRCNPVPSTAEVFDYLVFRGADIKSLFVCEEFASVSAEPEASDDAMPGAASPARTPADGCVDSMQNAAADDEALANISRQTHFYFSAVNLVQDEFLRQQMDQQSGWVPLVMVASFYRMQALSASPDLIAAALDSSSTLEVSQGHVRCHDWRFWVPPDPTVQRSSRLPRSNGASAMLDGTPHEPAEDPSTVADGSLPRGRSGALARFLARHVEPTRRSRRRRSDRRSKRRSRGSTPSAPRTGGSPSSLLSDGTIILGTEDASIAISSCEPSSDRHPAQPASGTTACSSALDGSLSAASARVRQQSIDSAPAPAVESSAAELRSTPSRVERIAAEQPEVALGAGLSALIVHAKTVLTALVDALRSTVQLRASTNEAKRIGKFDYTYACLEIEDLLARSRAFGGCKFACTRAISPTQSTCASASTIEWRAWSAP